MPQLQALKAAIARKDWVVAANLADELLIGNDIDDTAYVQMCYAQSMITAKISENMDELADPHRLKPLSVQLDPQEFRNAVSFLMEGFKRAVSKQLHDLVLMGASCFLRLTRELYLTGQLRLLFPIPLSMIAQGLSNCKVIKDEYLIHAHLLLAELLADYLDAKQAGLTPNKIVAWPTNEEHATFVGTASDRAITSLEAIIPFVKRRPNFYNIPFDIIKIYLKLVKANPAAKSTKIDQMLQKDSLLKTYSNIHGSSNTLGASDSVQLFATIDEKIKANDNCQQVLSFLLDLAEHSLQTGSLELSKQALEKSLLIHVKSNLNARRELVQCQFQLKVALRENAGKTKLIESCFLKLNHAICTAVEENVETHVIHSGCMTAWNSISSIEIAAPLVRVFSIVLKTICDVSQQCTSLFEPTQRCHFEYKLAQCYEFQNIFSLATTHAEQALKFSSQPELSNEIEILVHKLWIKANTFDGHLTPDLKALSLADQAKYIPEDKVAFKLIQKSIKTLIPDHDLISPPTTIKMDDLVLSLLKNDYAINFDIIGAADIKNKRTILVTLSDVMRQSRELAQRQTNSMPEEKIKYWKAVWDASKYLTTLDIDALVDPVSAQKLKAEALLYQGEAILTFEEIRPYAHTSMAATHNLAENLKTIHHAVVDPMIQSLNIGIGIKDSHSIQSAASKICDYFSVAKSNLSPSMLSLWTETFQRLHEGFMECQLQHTSLMVDVCIGYATVLNEANKQAAEIAAITAAANTAATVVAATDEKPSPTKGGKGEKEKKRGASPDKGEKDKKAAPAADKGKTTAKQLPVQPISNNFKLIDGIVNLGLSSAAGGYEMKLALFDLKMAMKLGTPITISDADPTMKIFTALEALEAKKGSKEDLEEAAKNLVWNGSKLERNLNFELWLRVIQHACNAEFYHLAYMSIQNLYESSPEGANTATSTAGIRPKLMLSGELLYGQILLSLIDCEMLFASATIMLDISELQSSLKLLCNSASVGDPQKQYIPHLERVLSTLYSRYFSNVHIQNLINSNQKTQEAILKMTEICLQVYKEKCDWTASSRLLDRSYRILPKAYHQLLLKRKIQTLCLGKKSGTSVLLKDVDAQTRFEMWFMLTDFATETERQNTAFQECIKSISDDPLLIEKRTEVELLYSRWILENRTDHEAARLLVNMAIKTTALLLPNKNVNSVVLFMQANILAAELEPNQRLKSTVLMEVFDSIIKLIEPLTVLPPPPAEANPVSKESQPATKSRAATPASERLPAKSLESWVGYDWPQSAKDAFAHSVNPKTLAKATVSNPRQFLSCLLFLILQFEESGQLLHCVPLLAAANLIVSGCIPSNQAGLMNSALFLYSAVIHSKLYYVELAAKFRRLYNSSEQSIDGLTPLWNNMYAGCDIGHPLDRQNVLLLKANLLIQYGELLKANTLITRWMPLEVSHQNLEVLYLSSLLTWTSQSQQGDTDLFRIETYKQAVVFAKFVYRLVKTNSVAVFETRAAQVVQLCDTCSELVAGNDRVLLMLWQTKYSLGRTHLHASEEELAVAFQACLELSKSMELYTQQAEIIFQQAKFMRSTSLSLGGRKLAQQLLSALDLLEECKVLCDSMKTVEKTPSWFLLGYQVSLEEADLLFQIGREGDLIESNQRTIEVMLQEHFIPEGQVSLSKRWMSVQMGAIEKVIHSLKGNIASFPLNSQIAGRRILGLCHKIMYDGLCESNMEDASAHLRMSKLQLTQALKGSVQVGDIDTARICSSELLTCDTTCDEFTRMSNLALLQSCENWKYLVDLFGQVNPQPLSQLVLGTVNEAQQRLPMTLNQNISFKRTHAVQITPESLSDLPKNVKVLLLNHSKDQARLFGSVVYRIKESSGGKSKSPIDDFFIATVVLETNSLDFSSISDRVKHLQSHSLEGAVADSKLIDDIYAYLQPVLKLLETEPTTKSSEKTDAKKKGAAKTVASGEIEEVDRGHCVICSDALLEFVPIELVLRTKNLATSSSREFGLSYLLMRIKFAPGGASSDASSAAAPPTPKKGAATASAVDKWDVNSLKAFSTCDLSGVDYFGVLPPTLKFDYLQGDLNANELLTGIGGATAAILLDKHGALDPSCLVGVHAPPNLLVYLAEAESGEVTRLVAKRVAAMNFLNGISVTMATVLPVHAHQLQAFARQFVKSKDAVKLRADMTSEEILNKRMLFGAHFIQVFGFL
ncbi:hypothetical protein HDU98_009529 [Podochytrium sp. JEL0797]|nr:hypothetical protein HDU98_009529 [Podochytrium sp. JEL0797]